MVEILICFILKSFNMQYKCHISQLMSFFIITVRVCSTRKISDPVENNKREQCSQTQNFKNYKVERLTYNYCGFCGNYN